MDIAQAQGLLGRRGEIDQIDVMFADGAAVGAAVERLQQHLGPSVLVLAANEREEQVTGLLQAFRLNLTALSLISIFVGVFLIFSSTQAALVRRRTEFGMLRSLGATSGQLLRIVLGEVALLGVLGTGIGLWLGHWIAARNIDVVSGTLTNLYLLSEIERLEMPPYLWALAAVVGVGGALAGALIPGLDLSRRDTFALLRAFTLHERANRWAPRVALLGMALLAVGGAWFALWGRGWRPGGFVLGLVVMLALPSFTPLVVRALCARTRVRGLGPSLGIRNLGVRLTTSSFAVAALAVAVSMLISVTLLIGSFRRTLATWVDTTIRADVFVTTPSWARAGTDATLDASIIAAMRAHPRVQNVEMLRQFPVYVGERRIRFSGLTTQHPQIAQRIPLRDGNVEEVWEAVRTQGQCLISEPLARKEKLGVGDTLVVSAPDGPARILIAGVSYDYATDAGAALVDLEVCERLFGPGPINNIALFLVPGSDTDRVMDELRAQFPDAALFLRSNAELRKDIFDIFDQTFAITRILQVMALLVAVCGIALTLLVLARERVAELALYGSLGALRTQIFRLFVSEGLSIGVIGLGLGLAGGVGLGLILMYVINPMYFGWTIRPAWPAAAVLQQMATILSAALVASIYPALRASRTPARELSRDDL
jgi:putative ABC transport system permease protein